MHSFLRGTKIPVPPSFSRGARGKKFSCLVMYLGSSEKWVETPSFDRLRNTLQDGFTDCLVKCET
jgi:hypothetical protein